MNTFIGTVSKIVDPDLYTIEVDVPGYNKSLPAFPVRGELDEPRVGDIVLLEELDSVYKSYYLWRKLKENKFIGVRSRGKLIKISPEEISIGIYDPSDTSWYDKNDASDSTPKPTAWLKIDKGGNIDICATGKETISITGDSTVKVGGNTKITVSGNADVSVSGNTKISSSGNIDVSASGNATIKSPNVKITGGQLSVNGTAAPSGSGPFCGIPVCPFSGAPHIGNMVSGT